MQNFDNHDLHCNCKFSESRVVSRELSVESCRSCETVHQHQIISKQWKVSNRLRNIAGFLIMATKYILWKDTVPYNMLITLSLDIFYKKDTGKLDITRNVFIGHVCLHISTFITKVKNFQMDRQNLMDTGKSKCRPTCLRVRA